MKRRGGAILETALWTPFLVVLMMGAVEIGRLTYTYYQIQKMMVNLARYLGTQQAVNFCDDTDATVVSAKQWVLTGTSDGSGQPIIRDLTADRVSVRIERYTAETGSLGQCDCAVSATGCDAGQGAPSPDYIVVSIPEGYQMRVVIPSLGLDPILLRPVVRVPFGGT
jgi:hypothetical protein